jgi:hypothetical protein
LKSKNNCKHGFENRSSRNKRSLLWHLILTFALKIEMQEDAVVDFVGFVDFVDFVDFDSLGTVTVTPATIVREQTRKKRDFSISFSSNLEKVKVCSSKYRAVYHQCEILNAFTSLCETMYTMEP